MLQINLNNLEILLTTFSGNCGISQPGASSTMPLFLADLLDESLSTHLRPQRKKMSHEMCNEFFVNSFEHDFIANNTMSCSNVIDLSQLPVNFKMGFMEKRRK